MNLERDLYRALQRREPDPGFAQRVMAGIGEDRSRHRPVWWRAAAASVTLAVVLGGYGTYKYIEIQRGERAKKELLLAMRIAGEKVSVAREQVRAIGSHH